MTRCITAVCLAVITQSAGEIAYAAEPGAQPEKKNPYGNPDRFAQAIQAFETEDQTHRPAPGGIVATGSSSMRGWHKTICEDLAPLMIIPRGFGGSNYNDLLHFADRVILAYRPRAAIIYEGDNDIASGASPELVRDTFARIVALLHEKQPDLRVYVISIKPSLKRWAMWPKMKQANELLKAVCDGDKRLTFVDVSAAMLDESGAPRKDIFAQDGLHMNAAGYAIWRGLLRPILVEKESAFEGK